MARIAMKIAYEGSPFSGYARQPRLRTVEGEVVRALLRARAIDDNRSSRFEGASRTDRGVSAFGNVVAFDTWLAPAPAVRAFNAKARDVWAWAATSVPATFRARRARERWYRYHLPGDHRASALDAALRVFQGEHDFRAFTRDKDRSIARIDAATAGREGDAVVLDFRAPSFRWNLVRRIVAAALQVEAGKASVGDLEEALQGTRPFDFGLAPAEPLVLQDIRYDVEFDPVWDPTTEQRLHRLLDGRIRKVRFHESLLERLRAPRAVEPLI